MVASDHHHPPVVGQGLAHMHAIPKVKGGVFVLSMKSLYLNTAGAALAAGLAVWALVEWADYQRSKYYGFAGKSRALGDWRPSGPPRSLGALKKAQAESLQG